MAPRAQWKGYLKIDEVTCPVALFTAASEAERVSFHTLNRESGNRVRRIFVDSMTERPVEREDQIKGYEVDKDQYVFFEPEEIAAVTPASDKTISVDAFIACSDIDPVYFDKSYYLTPASGDAEESYYLIQSGMREDNVAAIGQAVLFRRLRTLLIRAHGPGLIATLLNYQYEVRSAKEAFEEIPKVKIAGEMLDLAKHILKTKSGEFDITQFDDRYEAALADLVKAKIEGKPIRRAKAPASTKVVDLMDALRKSAKEAKEGHGGRRKSKANATPKSKRKQKMSNTPRRKAG